MADRSLKLFPCLMGLTLVGLSACTSGGSGVSLGGTSSLAGTPRASGQNAGAASDTLIASSGEEFRLGQYTALFDNDGNNATSNDSVTLHDQDQYRAHIDTNSSTGATFTLEGTSETISLGALSANASVATTDVSTGNTISVNAKVGPEYMMYGAWLRDDGTDIRFGGFTTGEQTLAARMPSSGTATYDGGFLGYTSLSTSNEPELFEVTGDSQVVVNFGTNGITGTFDNLTVDSSGSNVTMNDITFTATLSGVSYTGTVTAGAATGNAFDITAGTTGDLTGWFYGYDAEETGGTVSIADSDNALIGGYGAVD